MNYRIWARILVSLALTCACFSCNRDSTPANVDEAVVKVNRILKGENLSAAELNQAEKLLLPFADEKNLLAIGALGELYITKPDEFRDKLSIAIPMLKQSALAGNGSAALSLSLAYAEGKVVLSNQLEASRWACLSAWQGDDIGMNFFASFLDAGEVIEHDAIGALAWRIIAATHGNFGQKILEKNLSRFSVRERLAAESRAREIAEKMADNRRRGILPPGWKEPSGGL